VRVGRIDFSTAPRAACIGQEHAARLGKSVSFYALTFTPPNLGEFILTHPALQIPPDTQESAINAPNSRFWETPVKTLCGRVPGRQERSARQGSG
jgi:fructose-1,6-bisphosphatase